MVQKPVQDSLRLDDCELGGQEIRGSKISRGIDEAGRDSET